MTYGGIITTPLLGVKLGEEQTALRPDHVAAGVGPVAGAADVANHAVGGVGDAATITIPELRPKQALCPAGPGGVVSAGGQARMLCRNDESHLIEHNYANGVS
jgi:hypothetical protein